MGESEAIEAPTAQDWSIYLVRCADGSLYTGIATDVGRRIQQHSSGEGRGAKYLRGRGPLCLEVHRSVGSRSLALRVERQVKRLPKEGKERLVAQPAELADLIATVAADDCA